MEPTLRLLAILLSAICAECVCNGVGGDFCEGTCCLWPNGTIAYCCSNWPYPTKCCGFGMCCPEESTCSMNCTSNATTCVSGTPAMSSVPAADFTPQNTFSSSSLAPYDRDDEACDLSQDQCCMGTCCQECCGGSICAPDKHVCCKPVPGYATEPTSYCPAVTPVCCRAADGNTTCCTTSSLCCTDSSCPADSACCGSCNCCNTKTQRCLEDGSCEHVPEGVMIPVLMWMWGFAFFTNLAFLGMKYYDYQNLESVNSNVCLECFHPAHCSLELCDNKRVNTSPDCATCSIHCRRTGCHLGPCGLPYTAQERMIREGDDEGETVSFKVVHGKCPCEECQCSRCVPYFACWCTQCGCAACKSTNSLRPFVMSSVAGLIVLLITVLIHVLADQNDCTMSLILFTVGWVIGSAFLVVYLRPKQKPSRTSTDQAPHNTATNDVPESYSPLPAYVSLT